MKKYDNFNKFFLGVNYWESKSAINMWSNFNEDVIRSDFTALKNAGVTHLRVFPLWPVFQPLTALYKTGGIMEYTFGENPLPNTEAGKAGVSEEAMQNFERFCSLANEFDLKLIVALITGHMSFRNYAPPAFDGKNLLTDHTVMKWQKRFVTYFVNRLKNQDCIIAWDLGNEPIHLQDLKSDNEPIDSFYVWCSVIYGAVKSVDTVHPVISGLDEFSIEQGYVNLKSIGDVCDIHTVHPYNIFQTNFTPVNSLLPIIDLPFKCQICEDISDTATFPQEFGSIGYLNCSKQTEADFYRACLYATISHNFNGTMWWCAFDQGHHNFAPYRWNTIGSKYGFFDKDFNAKPIVKENVEFNKVLRKLDGKLPPKNINATIIVQRDDGNCELLDKLRVTYSLLAQSNVSAKFIYATDLEVEKSPLYFFPCPNGNISILKQTFDAVLNHVNEGSVLYISLDCGLLRYVNEITGIDFACREKLFKENTVNFNGENFKIQSTFNYVIENSNATTLAQDSNGNGVFFKAKYGKGYVCLLTLPLEKYLADNPTAFYKNDTANYQNFYREVIKLANVKRLADTNSKFVLLTENVIDENNAFICLINYASFTQTTTLTLFGNFTAYDLNDNKIDDLTITFKPNECLILKLKR